MDPDRSTLGDVLRETSSRHPDRTALIGADRRLTWAELDAEVDGVAHLLDRTGIGPGDALGLCISKRPEVVITFLALGRIGAVAAPVNFKAEPARVVEQFQDGHLAGVLLEPRFDALVAPVERQLGGRILAIDGDSALGGTRYERQAEMPRTPFARTVSPHDPCYYNYTSGTTGRPKGAVATHANILWNSVSGVDGLGFAEEDVFLGMFSVFAHPHELFNRSLVTGGTFVILDTMSPRVVAQAVEEHRITWMMAVPSFYEMMLAHVGGDAFDVSSLRVLESGGAWVPPDTLTRLEERFGCGFMPVWGSTETSGVALAMRPDRPRRAGATGEPVAHYEVGVFDDKGRPVPDGETGEMWVKGPAVASCYVNMPRETERAFHDGWYRTSDLVKRDPDGFYFFVGRRSDMLKVGGIRVFPLEIEQVLVEHPAVAEVVVVRAEERVRGEIPRAVVRLQEGAALDERDLKAWCRRHLAVYKVPRIVEFWESIPKLPNGKIDRKAVEATPAGGGS